MLKLFQCFSTVDKAKIIDNIKVHTIHTLHQQNKHKLQKTFILHNFFQLSRVSQHLQKLYQNLHLLYVFSSLRQQKQGLTSGYRPTGKGREPADPDKNRFQ